ncbi:MAG: hypothetical protein ACRDRJ_32885 [Streptosporangiaceae bacterium]
MPRAAAIVAGGRLYAGAWRECLYAFSLPVVCSHPATVYPQLARGQFTSAEIQLTPGTTYRSSVVAASAAGYSKPSARSNAVTPTDTPGPPRSITLTPGNGQLTLDWQPPASDGGPSPALVVARSSAGRVFRIVYRGGRG